MPRRDHAMREQYEAIGRINAKADLMAKNTALKNNSERLDLINKLDRYRDQRELKLSKKVGLSEAVYDDMLGTAFKAIYVTALGPISETSEAIACDNVDRYIRENGGARNIIRHNYGKTYLLDTLFEFVNDAALQEIENQNREEALIEAELDPKNKKKKEDNKNIDEEDPENDDENFEPADDENSEEEVDTDKIDKVDPQEEKDAEKTPEESEEDASVDPTIDDDDEEISDLEDDLSEDENNNDQSEDEEKPEEEPDPYEEDPLENPPDSKEDLFNKMENEDDITAAVDLIAQRIQSAESEFIEKNAQDKRKIEKIVDNLNNRLKAVNGEDDNIDSDNDNLDMNNNEENIDTEDNTENQDAEKAKVESARMISDIKYGRRHSVFEEMVMSNANYIIKNSNHVNAINENYIDESGKINVGNIVEATKVIYGFLEFVNTIKLEKVNEDFVSDVLNEGFFSKHKINSAAYRK